MNTHIVINKRIYENYKDEILPLSARLFCDEYFYDLANYKEPIELIGIKNYLSYIDEIILYTTATCLDFINILLVLSFLKNNNYKGVVNIKYYLLTSTKLKDGMFMETSLNDSDLSLVDELLNNIKNNKLVKNNGLKLPGLINYINYYNILVDDDNFDFYFQEMIEEYEDDIDSFAEYLSEKYINMGLNKQFYINFLKKRGK